MSEICHIRFLRDHVDENGEYFKKGERRIVDSDTAKKFVRLNVAIITQRITRASPEGPELIIERRVR